MEVRPPAVAGLFYPGNQTNLSQLVDQLLESVVVPGLAPKAMILPHAGYRYSGQMAAQGYATLPAAAADLKQVVLLGPNHRVGLPAIALPGVEAMATPLGEVQIWAEGVAIASQFSQVVTSPEVHAEEHSLEVHLPFLQRTLPHIPVLPLAVGWVEPEAVAEVLDAVWGGPETLVIVSSDLSHYHPYSQAKAIDQATISQVLKLGPPLETEQACGATPINGLLEVAARRGMVPAMVDACSSGDTSFDHSRVVGYTFIRFDEPGALNA